MSWATSGLMTSLSGDWRTPPELRQALDAEFHFNFEAAPFEGEKVDDLHAGACWGTSTFMNPPYGRKIGLWVRKAYVSAQRGATVVCLLPARTDTAWWHDYCMEGEIRFLRGRLYFINADGSSRGRAPFPSAIVIFRARNSPLASEGPRRDQ